MSDELLKNWEIERKIYREERDKQIEELKIDWSDTKEIIKRLRISTKKLNLQLIELLENRKDNFNLFQYKVKLPMHIKKIIYNYWGINKDIKYLKQCVKFL